MPATTQVKPHLGATLRRGLSPRTTTAPGLDACARPVAALLVAAALTLPGVASAATFTVDSLEDTSDANLRDAVCGDDQGRCTLRAALEQSNATRGRDTITLAVPQARMALERPLPTITDAVFLDAGEQPEGLTLEGGGLGAQATGLRIEVGGVTLRGLTVRGFGGAGITFTPDAPDEALELVALAITDNCGWGLDAGGTVHVGLLDGREVPDQRTRLAFNGAGGPECQGGGLLALGDLLGRGLELQGNAGPGALVRGHITLTAVTSQTNAGAGLRSLEGQIWLRGQSPQGQDNAIRFNQGDGVAAALDCDLPRGVGEPCYAVEVASADIEDNGGWGVHAGAGAARLGARRGQEITHGGLRRNGTGDRCFAWSLVDDRPARQQRPCGGGGVFASRLIHAQGLAIDANEGPGLMSGGLIRLTDVTTQGNRASGAHSTGGDLEILGLETRVAGNGGHGLLAPRGQLRVEGVAEVVDNGAWGAMVRGPIALTRAQDQGRRVRNVFSRNGLGRQCERWRQGQQGPTPAEEPCLGGGLASLEAPATLDNLTAQANGGPGALIEGTVDGDELDLSSNEGPGLQARGDVSLGQGEARLVENLGPGLITPGTLRATNLSCTGNGAWGAEVGQGAELGDDQQGATFSGNGQGDLCLRWTLSPFPTPEEFPCDGGGLQIKEGTLTAINLVASANAGDGVRVAAQAASLESFQATGNQGVGVAAGGDLRLVGGFVCENRRGPFNAGGQLTLEAVEVCGDTDGDGVTDDAENRGGDTDGDGIADSLQPHVAALPLEGGQVIGVSVAANLRLQNVSLSDDAPEGFPEDATRLLPFLDVGVIGLARGASATITLRLPQGTAADTWMTTPAPRPDAPTWVDAREADGATLELLGDVLALTLIDGSQADRDGNANGALAITGAAADLPGDPDANNDPNNDPDNDPNNDPGNNDGDPDETPGDDEAGTDRPVVVALCGCTSLTHPVRATPGALLLLALGLTLALRRRRQPAAPSQEDLP